MTEPDINYTNDFYVHRRSETIHSARAILSVVKSRYDFASVVDVGCGTGTWLSVARELGAESILGFEGPWLELESVDESDIPIVRLDLEDPIEESRRFDLCVCLEVAEHLSPPRAETLIRDLTSLAPVVLFSAAIPGQGGDGHINEQWQDYWADLFAQHGFWPADMIRPLVWNDPAIPYWYRQNTILYASIETLSTTGTGFPLNVVHPATFSDALGQRRTPRLRRLRSVIRRVLRGRQN